MNGGMLKTLDSEKKPPKSQHYISFFFKYLHLCGHSLSLCCSFFCFVLFCVLFVLLWSLCFNNVAV